MRLSETVGKKSRFLFLFLLSAVLLLQLSCGEKDDDAGVPRITVERTARVKYVIDGDTLETEDGERLRFLGINTPEIRKRPDDPPDQPWGRDAANFVTLLLPPGTEIGLAFDDGPREGAYGRTLAYIIVDGELLNALLLREGYGRFNDYGKELKLGEYLKRMEGQARVYGKGVWEGQGKIAAPRYYVASKNGKQYHDPDSDLAPQISKKNLVRLTEESARMVGLEPGRSVR
jgi:micrococcal nuclease